MFRNTFQSGFLSIFYSVGSKPLQIWDIKAQDGTVDKMVDEDLGSTVMELKGQNVATTYISCPADPSKVLGVKLPFLVVMIKNMDEHFSLEVTVLDDKNVKRRFRASNFQATTRVQDSICTMPLKLEPGWNQIQFDLADFLRRAYGTSYVETLRVQLHCSCRLRRVYFADKAYSEEELPQEFKLFVPARGSKAVVGVGGAVKGGREASPAAAAGALDSAANETTQN